MFSYAQNFEDVMLARIFAGQQDGFYVDVGAAHPSDLSVTRHFYDLGWRGINIEPVPANFKLFAKQRPGDTNLNCAVGFPEGPATFFEVTGNTALSTFDADRASELEASGEHIESYPVEIRRLDSILQQYAAGKAIDFLKVDAEGLEDQILRSVDLGKWRPKVLLIEAVRPIDAFPGWGTFNAGDLGNWGRWEPYVLDSGYVFAHFDGLNRYYLHRDFAFLADRLSIPPGVFDFIMPSVMETIGAEVRRAESAVVERLAKSQTDATISSELASISSRLGAIEAKLSVAGEETLRQLTWALEEKEAFIQRQEKELSAYRQRTFHPDRAMKRVIGRLRDILRPRLGDLRQHPATPPVAAAVDRIVPALSPAPVISLVTPSFNQGHFLGRTIASVLDQNYPALEYFVQDGGSTDDTLEVLQRYSTRLTGWQSAPDNGQSDAINKGFARARGEIMGWLNSDDILLPGSLHSVADYFNRHPDVDVVYGHRLLIDDNDQMIGRWIMPAHDDAVLSWADYVPQETLFWRRRIWERVGSQVDESFRFAMDWDLLLRFRAAGAKFARLPRLIGAFRIHEDQKTSSEMADTGQREMARLRARVLGRVPDDREIRRATTLYLIKHVMADFGWRIQRRLTARHWGKAAIADGS
ncbi:MAG: FkbM family methyltransferase [Xanthobacteraceae bacterium]|nr:FkbM family methyltransferase [Xanthobacteraceae bacterium]